MALTAYDSAGFEHCRNAAGFPHNAIKYAGSTGTTYTKGTPVVMSAGKLLELAYNAGPTAALPIVGICAETKTCATDDYMVQVIPTDGNVFNVTFVDHYDATCSGSSASNQFKIGVSSSLNASTSAVNGALLYIYEGPSKGDLVTVIGNTTGGSTSVTTLYVAPPFSASPTTLSKAVISAAYSSAIWAFPKNVGSIVKRSTDSASKVSLSVLDSSTMAVFAIQNVDMPNLKMDVTIAPSKAVFGLETTG